MGLLDGKVALVTGSLVMANLNERMEGVKEVLAEKYPDIEVVDTIATDDDFAKGLDVCEAMLRAHPDLDGVIAVSMTEHSINSVDTYSSTTGLGGEYL